MDETHYEQPSNEELEKAFTQGRDVIKVDTVKISKYRENIADKSYQSIYLDKVVGLEYKYKRNSNLFNTSMFLFVLALLFFVLEYIDVILLLDVVNGTVLGLFFSVLGVVTLLLFAYLVETHIFIKTDNYEISCFYSKDLFDYLENKLEKMKQKKRNVFA